MKNITHDFIETLDSRALLLPLKSISRCSTLPAPPLSPADVVLLQAAPIPPVPLPGKDAPACQTAPLCDNGVLPMEPPWWVEAPLEL
jgi:hypothetical protein